MHTKVHWILECNWIWNWNLQEIYDFNKLNETSPAETHWLQTHACAIVIVALIVFYFPVTFTSSVTNVRAKYTFKNVFIVFCIF